MTLPRPQRIAPPSPRGSLLKGVVMPSQPRSTETDGDASYLALIRQCPCLRCGMDPAGVAAHLRQNSALHGKRQAMAKKPEAKWVTPLCAGCHTNDADAQHRLGELAFWDRLGINPFMACERLYAQAGDLVALRAVVFMIIAERRTT